ncbi:sporulation integral membrane protein YtvI [Piscirickettsia salmonis]|uniref:AI-2E family transporter n=1 Tax=Piscirickettsia salmonis TaxID=1238 RepID=UPI0012BB069C|nr:AI-2E family transporter [Piscirickettsia salmonis]QGP53730.1 sporulation integral membrane protein YtvI [Piscirickettsia salmonis]QGP60359.1 sporulation integral membrane protein YtvI [Piscirickettsia salmonis]QGP63303.1 sporulation integral membrane protein YtvI [Piscirickettsia salmonis]
MHIKRWLLPASIAGFFLLVYLLSSILGSFFAAILLAYLGSPWVLRLESYHIPRTLSVLVILFLIGAVLFSLPLIIIPMVEMQVVLLINQLPKINHYLQSHIFPLLSHYLHLDVKTFNLNLPDLTQKFSMLLTQNPDLLKISWNTVFSSGIKIIEWGIQLVLVPVVAFYFLRDWNTILAKGRNLLPRRLEPTLYKLITTCDEVLAAFLRGQLFVMLCLGIFYALGLSVVGLKTAVLIGMLVGIISIVPYLGSIAGIIIAVLSAIAQFQDISHIIYVLIVFVLGHALEGWVLTPLLVGDRIGLHPVAVIFAVLAGGQLFGFAGVLLALPAAAIIMVIIRYFYQDYISSHFYQQESQYSSAPAADELDSLEK